MLISFNVNQFGFFTGRPRNGDGINLLMLLKTYVHFCLSLRQEVYDGEEFPLDGQISSFDDDFSPDASRITLFTPK